MRKAPTTKQNQTKNYRKSRYNISCRALLHGSISLSHIVGVSSYSHQHASSNIMWRMHFSRIHTATDRQSCTIATVSVHCVCVCVFMRPKGPFYAYMSLCCIVNYLPGVKQVEHTFCVATNDVMVFVFGGMSHFESKVYK